MKKATYLQIYDNGEKPFFRGNLNKYLQRKIVTNSPMKNYNKIEITFNLSRSVN